MKQGSDKNLAINEGRQRFEMNQEFKNIIDEQAKKIVREYMNSSAFVDKKITDTPTDAFSVVNRKYVTLNGATANRPTSSVIGQSYFDTTLGIPVWWNGTSFVDAQGNVV